LATFCVKAFCGVRSLAILRPVSQKREVWPSGPLHNSVRSQGCNWRNGAVLRLTAPNSSPRRRPSPAPSTAWKRRSRDGSPAARRFPNRRPGGLIAAKTVLYLALRAAGLSPAELARRTGVRPTTVQRLLDPCHARKPEPFDAAFAALGKRLVVSVETAAWFTHPARTHLEEHYPWLPSFRVICCLFVPIWTMGEVRLPDDRWQMSGIRRERWSSAWRRAWILRMRRGFDKMTTFDDKWRLLTIAVARAQRFAGVGFVWNQGVEGRCGSEMKGY